MVWLPVVIGMLFSTQARPAQVSGALNSPEEQALLTTSYIVSPQPDGTGTTGTGFIVRMPSKNGGHRTLLVSASHVFPENRQSMAYFHIRSSQDSHVVDLKRVAPVMLDKSDRFFYRSPNPDLDLACADITAVEDKLFIVSYPLDLFASLDEPGLVPAADVSFLGYPRDRFDHVNYLPITRKGSISSLPRVDYDGKPEFIIDAQVYPGSSGSPVIWVKGNAVKFLGLVKAVMIHQEIKKEEPKKSDPKITIARTSGVLPAPGAVEAPNTEFLGLGYVIKAPQIAAFLKDAVARFDR